MECEKAAARVGPFLDLPARIEGNAGDPPARSTESLVVARATNSADGRNGARSGFGRIGFAFGKNVRPAGYAAAAGRCLAQCVQRAEMDRGSGRRSLSPRGVHVLEAHQRLPQHVIDAPSRDICTARRIDTNTPLQALTTLNDEAYIECAKSLAKRMQTAAGPNIRPELAWAFTEVTGQPAPEETLTTLEKLFDQAVASYEKNVDLAKKLANSPAEAARTLAANAILDLDQALSK